MGGSRRKGGRRDKETRQQLVRIFFAEGDGRGWAIDEDLRLLKRGVAAYGSESSFNRAEAVLAVWWWKLLRLPQEQLAKKRVIALADNPPFIYAQHPSFLAGSALVDLWVARSQEALQQFEQLGLPVVFAPYAVDSSVFRPLPPDDPALAAMHRRVAAPQGAFLVGNFHRDTEMSGCPKEQKAPEVFLKIVLAARKQGVPVYPVLAGPRRHWLRSAFQSEGVRCAFIGDETLRADDYPANILPRSELNLLYNLIDLYLIPSRWEGGPHSVLEAAAAGCPLLSTPVGVSRDLLPSDQLFNSVAEGVRLLTKEFYTREIRNRTSRLRQDFLESHQPERLAKRFGEILNDTSSVVARAEARQIWSHEFEPNFCTRIRRGLARMVRGGLRVRVKDRSNESSAGAAFLNSTRKWMEACRVRFVENNMMTHLELVAHNDRAVLRSLAEGGRSVSIFFELRPFLESLRGQARPWNATLMPSEFECGRRSGVVGDEERITDWDGALIMSRESGRTVAARFAELAEMVAEG